MKIAEALVLRKHLEAKVKQLEPVKVAGENGAFELKTERVKVTDEVDEVKFQIPKVELKSITKEYDMYSKALRQLDTAIQAANWQYEVSVDLDKDIAV
jgi:ribosome-associated translation inhibitor RaiA